MTSDTLTAAPEVTAHPQRSMRYCLVVVPTYNEALNIEPLIEQILAQGPQFDLLVVDDGSPDGTGDLVAAVAATNPRVQLLRRPGKLGLGTAYLAGFRHGLRAGYSYICEMDADFSHQPRYLPQLLGRAEREADLVLGSRNVPGGRVENWSLARQLLSKGGSLYARTVLAMPVRDCTGGFKCFRAEVLRRIDLDSIRSSGYAFQVELNYRVHQAGFRISELPIVFPDRVAGSSKMSRRIVLEAALMVLSLRLSATTDDRRPTTAPAAPRSAPCGASVVHSTEPALLARELSGRLGEQAERRNG
jgi:dolichol-phosphate mannosyltransferase